MPNKSKAHQQDAPKEDVPVIRDVLDFHVRWPELRVHVASIQDLETVSETQKECLKWLMELADRVQHSDF